MDKDIEKKIQQWLNPEYGSEITTEVQSLIDQKEESELIDAFYKDLEFGTAGLRGLMGVGTNRINKFTIAKATQGLSNYLKKEYPNQKIKVAVSYDSRNNSQLFGHLVADVFSANEIHVYLFEELRPTPLLSFAVRHFGCQSGVMLTASHNPKEYNGYKAYWNDGGQLIAPQDTIAIKEVNAVEGISNIKFDRNPDFIHLIKDQLDDIYITENKKLSLSPDIVKKQEDLKIVYSSIHGTGITMVPKMLKAWGFNNVAIVDEQKEPNGNFPTVIYPNPEEEEAMALALKKGEEINADLVLATDPDADRVGIGVPDVSGRIQLLNGNQISSLLTYYILSVKGERNDLKKNDYVVKTIVTTSLISEIAKSYNVNSYDTLTGFKYIGEKITKLEGKETYLVGGEESYGFLVGEIVRDKDAINSCAFIAEMTAYFKEKGKTLFQVLLEIYQKYGLYKERLISITKKGKAGAEEIKKMMIDLREHKPKKLGGIEVKEVRDYSSSIVFDLEKNSSTKIDLPKSDVLQFITVDGDVISARPSGTEPKIKFYCSVKTPMKNIDDYHHLLEKLNGKIELIMKDLISG